jgi:Fe2+ transport system protein FeoA
LSCFRSHIITIIIYVYGRLRNSVVTLADLKPGDKVAIESIAVCGAAVERLMVLGLVEGAELTFLRASLGGDPLEFRIFGAAISLRREQARCFTVAPVAS